MKRQFLLQFAGASVEEEKRELIESLFAQYAEEMEREKEEAEARRADVEAQVHSLAEERDAAVADLSDMKRLQANELQAYEERLRTATEELERNKVIVVAEAQARRETVGALEEEKEETRRSRQRIEAMGKLISELESKYGQLRRIIIAAAPVLLYAIALSVFRPWISGGFTWLATSGMLALCYVGILMAFRPFDKGHLGKLFTAGFPLVIAASVALPLGQGRVFLEVVGAIANVAGVMSLILFLLSGDSSTADI